MNVGQDNKHIHVFRLDVTEDSTRQGQYELRMLPMTRKGYVSGQEKTSIDHGFYWNCFGNTYAKKVRHTIRVRMYQRGYELIDIRSWQSNQPIQWKEIFGNRAQERAIDALLAPIESSSRPEQEGERFAHLKPGSVSPRHRDALLFAAAEYENLATTMEAVGEEEGACARCRAKAKDLRKLTGTSP